MTHAELKVHLKVGQIEIDYEGSSSFLRDDLPTIVQGLIDVQGQLPEPLPDPVVTAPSPATDTGSNNVGELSTDTIATVMKASTGPELIIAAVAHLHFVKKQPTSARKAIADEMRNAVSHFKDTYVSNLSVYLSGLTKAERLRLVAKDTYALSAKERTELGAKLANAG